MIYNIKIKNFKSIKDLSINLGRLNIIIGPNGSGKTNILEAIALASASSANKLDYEFLSNRMRLPHPEFMVNAFPKNKEKEIQINIKTHNKNYEYKLTNINDRTWKDINRVISQENIFNLFKDLFSGKDNPLIENNKDIKSFFSNLKDLFPNEETIENDETFNSIIPPIVDRIVSDNFSSKEISDFLIYTPEYTSLKKFEQPGQIIPLGIKGEGLFYTIKQIYKTSKITKQKETIKQKLHILDWFEDFYIPDNLISNEYKIAIKDKFLNPKIRFFDQKSANEGFLFLLFYLVLFTSKDTPKFFAIDNIETGFNPKLCSNLIVTLSELSKQYNKQVILTTHNPAILDGLNLNDDKQRLFVAYRKKDGATGLMRIKHKPYSKKKLSELWMSGIIGGLPDNF